MFQSGDLNLHPIPLAKQSAPEPGDIVRRVPGAVEKADKDGSGTQCNRQGNYENPEFKGMVKRICFVHSAKAQ